MKPPTKSAAAQARMERWLALDTKLSQVCAQRNLPTCAEDENFFGFHIDADTYEALLDELLSKKEGT